MPYYSVRAILSIHAENPAAAEAKAESLDDSSPLEGVTLLVDGEIKYVTDDTDDDEAY